MARPISTLGAFSVFILQLGLSLASSSPFESLHQVPRGWTHVRSAQAAESITLRVSLKQQNLDEFYEKLLQVSTPDHPQYGKHYEGHELRSLLKPADEASATAISWLQDNNVTDILDDGDYLMFRTTVGTANKLLDTQFGWYTGQDGMQMLRTTRYSVPQEVATHINFVQPTTRFGTARRLASHISILDTGTPADGTSKWVSVADNLRVNADAASAVDPACNKSITPQCLLQLYNVKFKADPAGGNTVGYASFVNESARFADMATFEQMYAPYAANRNVSGQADTAEHIWFGLSCRRYLG
jgi:tripeptidyl-peptidase I